MPTIITPEIRSLGRLLISQTPQDEKTVIASFISAADKIDYATRTYDSSLRLWRGILDRDRPTQEKQTAIDYPFARMLLASVTSEKSEIELRALMPQLNAISRRSRRQELLGHLYDQLSANLASVEEDRKQHTLLGRSESIFPVAKIASYYNDSAITPEAVQFLDTVVRQLDDSFPEAESNFGISLLFGIKDTEVFADITDAELQTAKHTINSAGKVVEAYLKKYFDAWLDIYLGKIPNSEINRDLLINSNILQMVLGSILTDKPIFAPWIYGDIMEKQLEPEAKATQLPFYMKHYEKRTHTSTRDTYDIDPFVYAQKAFDLGKSQQFAENLAQTILDENTQPAIQRLRENLPALIEATTKRSLITLEGDGQHIHHIDVSAKNGIIDITLIGTDDNALLLEVDRHGRVFGGLTSTDETRLEDIVFARIAPQLTAYFESHNLFPKPVAAPRRSYPTSSALASREERIAEYTQAQTPTAQNNEQPNEEAPTVASLGIPLAFTPSLVNFENFSIAHQHALLEKLSGLTYEQAEELAMDPAGIFETDTFGAQLEFLIEDNQIKQILVISAYEKKPLALS